MAEPARASRGLWFEDFAPGQKYETAPRPFPGRELDSFCELTGRKHPLHLDDGFARKAGFRARIAPGVYALSLLSQSLEESGLIRNLVAILGFDRVRFLSPLYPGETVRFTCEVLQTRATSKPDRGVVALRCRGFDGRGEGLLEADISVLIRRRASGPPTA
ncbi:MAG: MaoC/PaaZ C-terminal domain-containing protein [Halobacteria archaeon]